MRIPESALILPALYIIKRDGCVSTTKLIEELTDLFRPTGKDAEILDRRNDTHFSQKVRNLRSHREQNGMAVYTDLKQEGYVLTRAGETYLEENIDMAEYLFSNRFGGDDLANAVNALKTGGRQRKSVYVYSEEDMIREGRAEVGETVVRKRSRRLRQTAIERYRAPDGRLYCAVCGFCFEERYGELGRDFIEIHHEKPLFQYSEEDFEGYVPTAVEGVKPLCSNCHSMIHRDSRNPLTVEELKSRLQSK